VILARTLSGPDPYANAFVAAGVTRHRPSVGGI